MKYLFSNTRFFGLIIASFLAFCPAAAVAQADNCYVGPNVFKLMGDRSALANATPASSCYVGPNIFKLMGDHSALANATPASPCYVGPNIFKVMGDRSALANATPASPCHVGPNISEPTRASRSIQSGRGSFAPAARHRVVKRRLPTRRRLVQRY